MAAIIEIPTDLSRGIHRTLNTIRSSCNIVRWWHWCCGCLKYHNSGIEVDGSRILARSNSCRPGTIVHLHSFPLALATTNPILQCNLTSYQQCFYVCCCGSVMIGSVDIASVFNSCCSMFQIANNFLNACAFPVVWYRFVLLHWIILWFCCLRYCVCEMPLQYWWYIVAVICTHSGVSRRIDCKGKQS